MVDALGLYDSQRRSGIERIVGKLTLAGFGSTLLLSTGTFIVGAPLSPRFAILFGAAQFAVLVSERFAIYGLLRLARRFGRNTRNVLIIGSGPRAASVSDRISHNPQWGLRVVGYLDDSEVPVASRVPTEGIRKIVDIRSILRDEIIDEVVIAVPRSMFTSISPVVTACGEAGIPFTLLSDIFGDYLPPPAITRFGPFPALRFAAIHHNPTSIAVKRAVDVLGAAVGLAIALPVIGAAALAVKLTSPGPAFFRQTRAGLFGRRFRLMKLRTMVNDAEMQRAALAHLNEMSGPVFKIRDDPRVTPVGRWLRRTSLDELPQLWNVLRGDMSLVGPRPALPLETVQYQTFERRRLSMRPGLTCLWQVGGRNRVSEFDDWVRMDLEYIDTWTLALDLRILLQTIPAVLRATGS
jgi:exopolysaccharide biosynthesis polyprenyl glycosylphosphotransferase